MLGVVRRAHVLGRRTGPAGTGGGAMGVSVWVSDVTDEDVLDSSSPDSSLRASEDEQREEVVEDGDPEEVWPSRSTVDSTVLACARSQARTHS